MRWKTSEQLLVVDGASLREVYAYDPLSSFDPGPDGPDEDREKTTVEVSATDKKTLGVWRQDAERDRPCQHRRRGRRRKAACQTLTSDIIWGMRALLFVAVALLGGTASAKTITISPGDAFTKMEAAVAGDVVEIAPGTYKFRVNFSQDGTPTQPITVRAQDPANRPVWDLTGIPVGTAPGSYTAGDKHRGCWQFHGANYRVDGIVFRNCTDDSSAGVRVVNVAGIELRHCKFVGNTNGLTGAGDGLVVEYSEFDGNGHVFTAGDNPAHQIYIFGGTLAVRYSYFHDSPAGQNFHVRARDATLEYNWLTRPGSYMGDLMSCEYLCGGNGTAGITQKMLLRGNVIVQGTPANHSQLLVMLKDGGASADATGDVNAMQMTLIGNTIIGTSGYQNSLVHHLNDSGISTSAHLMNNLVTNFVRLNLIEAPAMMNHTVDGASNWLTTGTDATSVTGSLFGADAMLGAGYVPGTGSPVVGKATVSASAPVYEYYRDETVTQRGRARATAADIGAFEHGNAATPFDGYGVVPPPLDLGADADWPWAGDALIADGGTVAAMPGGCGCDVGAAGGGSGVVLVLGVLLLARLRRRDTR